MNIVNFPEANKVYNAPKDSPEVLDLPVFDAEGLKISCWEFTPAERLQAIFSNKIWLSVWLNFQPPVRVSPEYPFSLEGKVYEPMEVIVDRMIERKIKQFLDSQDVHDFQDLPYLMRFEDLETYLRDFAKFIFEIPSE